MLNFSNENVDVGWHITFVASSSLNPDRGRKLEPLHVNCSRFIAEIVIC